MAHLSYPTELTIPSPLLIEQRHLTELDTVLDQYSGPLRDEQEQKIQGRIERALSRRQSNTDLPDVVRQKIESEIRADYERERRAVAVYLSGGRTLAANRFDEAINQPHLTNELPVGFRCDLEIGQVEASITLRSRWASGVDVTARPNNSAPAQELFGALENWASEIRPPEWQRLWLKVSWFTRFLLFFWILLGLPFMLFGVEREAKDVYQPEARQLLQQGVNPNNQQRAIELTLAIISEAGTKTDIFRPGLRGWGFWVVGFLFLMALSICPEVVIGVWKGKQRLRFWRFWITTVWVSIPALIITSVIWPRLLAVVGIH
jgi:hypothetical protein